MGCKDVTLSYDDETKGDNGFKSVTSASDDDTKGILVLRM